MSREIDRSGGAVSYVLLGAFVCLTALAATDALAQTPTLDQLARDNVAQKMRLRTGAGLIAPAAASAVTAVRASTEGAPTAGIAPQRLLAVYGVESSLAAEIDFGGSIARMSNERPGPIAGWTLASIAPTHVVLMRRTGRGDEHRLLAMAGGGRDLSAGPGASKGSTAAIPVSGGPLSPLSPLSSLPIATRAPPR